MKLIKPSFAIIEQESGIVGMLQHIEKIGRVCYKSEDKITEDSYKKFVENIENRKHGAMLEHGTVYITTQNAEVVDKYLHNRYSVVVSNLNGYHITTNYRVLYENPGWIPDLQLMTKPSEYHEKRISVRFILDRGASHEFVRNRGNNGNAFAQESTRYCSYSSGKFDGEVTYCIPAWLGRDGLDEEFIKDLEANEATYLKWSAKGWQPQQARGFLNHFLKTELVITATLKDWAHFFFLRDSEAAHPSARELAQPLHHTFIAKGWLE
jgi:thymidylate synthase (FAD)